MKADLSEIAIILDESGSMQEITNDTIGGYNSFIETQKEIPGEAKLTLVKFNTDYNVIHNGLDIKTVPLLSNKTYYPSGSTALLDAVGRTIDEIGKRLSNTPEDEKPGKVILLIITDGEENSSKEYSLEVVKEKIKHQQEKYNWEIIYLGADQDSWENASSMNIHASANWDKSNMRGVFASASLYSANSRTYSKNTSIDNFSLTDEEVKKELEKYKI